MIGVRLHPPLLDALDAYIVSEPGNLSRPEAIRVLLADSLIGLGILQPKE